MLETSYARLDGVMATREWAAGDTFSLADCAAAPSLFYADWTHAIDAKFANVIAYRQRLLARPSFARCVDEARPFRPYFPLGPPDRKDGVEGKGWSVRVDLGGCGIIKKKKKK